jgi:hypothetical protein
MRRYSISKARSAHAHSLPILTTRMGTPNTLTLLHLESSHNRSPTPNHHSPYMNLSTYSSSKFNMSRKHPGTVVALHVWSKTHFSLLGEKEVPL